MENAKIVENTVLTETDNVNTDIISNNYITPEMFGAVGDGVADDTVAFQTAIQNAEDTDKLLLLSGNYKLNNTITITGSKLRIYGGSIYSEGNPVFQGNHSTPLRLHMADTFIEAPNKLFFDVYLLAAKISRCRFSRASVVFNHLHAMTVIDGCHAFYIHEAFIKGDYNVADSLITNCYINGTGGTTVLNKGTIDFDMTYSNCFIDYMLYLSDNGTDCVYHDCTINRVYSFFDYKNATTSNRIRANFYNCLFEFNTEEYLSEQQKANITEYLGFIVITSAVIQELKVVNPTEVDADYPTVYIVDSVDRRIWPTSASQKFMGIVLENVRYKNVLFSQSQAIFDNMKIIPDTIYSESETLTWIKNNHTVMCGFNGATVVHPSGKISKCVNINGVKSMVTIYTPQSE